MKRALITGITGQDGSYLTELLLENCQRFNEGRPLHNVVDKTQWF